MECDNITALIQSPMHNSSLVMISDNESVEANYSLRVTTSNNHSHSIVDTEDVICVSEFLSSFPDYLTYALILVLIACGVYQMMISVLKMIILSLCGGVYLILVHSASSFLFDQEDSILQQFGKMPPHFMPSKYFVIFIVLAFIVALMIHGHQTESTYRLDFLWKLQATGKKFFRIFSNIQ